jgi:biopolymer transport protein ExbB
MSKPGKMLIILGIVLLVLGLGGGLGGSVLGMIRTFDAMAAQGGAAHPADLAEGISAALLSTAVGLPVGLVGLVLLVVGLIVGLKGRKASNEVTG